MTVKEGKKLCDLCDGETEAHTNCLDCGKDVCKEHSSPVRDKDDKKWLGWKCTDCKPKEKTK